MALVGNISGSGGVSSTVGVTGSVIVANRPGASFPSLPGVDVAFFVSGNIAARSPGSPASSPDYSVRGTTVFGGDVVISGTLFGGSPLYIGDQVIARNGLVVTGTFQSTAGLSGSLTKLTDGTSYLIAGTNVTITTGSNGAVTIASIGGGGGGDSFFSSTTAGSIFTTGSAIFRGNETQDSPADIGSNLFFYVSGSRSVGANRPTSGVSSFGGDLVVTGALYTDGNVSVGGNIVADAEEAKSIFVGVGANNVTIGSSNASVVIGNYLAVTGNQISGSAGGNITLQSSGDVEILGDLKINGNDVKGSGGTTAITLSGADVSIAGDLTVTGNDIKSSTATALTLAGANVTAAGNLTVTGDLTVNGTTVTVDATTVSIEDPVIGFGFTSGSVTRGTPGDRGFIGGLDGENNVAFIWDESADGFGVFRTTSSTTSSLPVDIVDYSTFRAGKLELGGGISAFVTSSTGTNLIVSASNDLTLGSNSTVTNFAFGGVNRGLASQTNGFTFASALGTDLNISGSGTAFRLRHGDNGIVYQRHGNSYLTVASGSYTVAGFPIANAALITTNGINGTLFGGQGVMTLSGSTVYANAGQAGGHYWQSDGSNFARLFSGGVNRFDLDSQGAFTIANLVNSTPTTVNLAGNASVLLNMGNTSGQTWISGSVTVPGTFSARGAVTLGDATSDNITFTGRAASDLVPNTNNAYDLGTPELRWRNMYTGDLHLKNERGNWTIIEEEEYLSITNNISGKRYKFVLEEL